MLSSASASTKVPYCASQVPAGRRTLTQSWVLQVVGPRRRRRGDDGGGDDGGGGGDGQGGQGADRKEPRWQQQRRLGQ